MNNNGDHPKPIASQPNIAVLIDAENGSNPQRIESLMTQLNGYGNIVVKLAIGNWTKNRICKKIDWRADGFKVINQTQQAPGHNGSDFRLVIEAMELVYDPRLDIDTFVVMSSDQGFIPLYQRLRKMGKTVFVAGSKSLKNRRIRATTDRIMMLDGHNQLPKSNAVEAGPSPNNKRSRRNTTKVVNRPMKRPHRNETRILIRRSLTRLGSERRRATPLNMYRMMKRFNPNFSVRELGYSKMIDLLESFPEIITVMSTGPDDVWVRFGRNKPKRNTH